ncbi:Ubiquitin-like-specific protease ESD4 [Apiospora phragmitis]|uniref:Ubiquitin-like-specific protease ESD4 n=1 Tax=Apiospora phragmitis TaxID=2905665 RepID=A0ABR1WSU3_9PEZI
MPINESSHWTFILIRPKRREVAYIDSFGGKGPQKVLKTLEFIEVFLGPARWDPEEWKVLNDLHVPDQHNSWDCGMFVITNSIYIALGLDPNTYSEAELPLQRRRIAAVLLNGGFKDDFNLEDL